MESMNEWMPQSAAEVTVDMLNQAVLNMKQAREAYDLKKQEASQLYDKVEEAEKNLVNLLKAAGRTKFELEGIGTAYISTKETYKVPADTQAKKLLFDYIKEKHGGQVLMTMASINHNTLNSWAKKELEADPLVVIPGLDTPTSVETLGFRKK